MSESPSPHDFFDLGLRVAWHLCDCKSRPDILKMRISGASHAVTEILRGNLILHDSPADSRSQPTNLVEWLRQQDDEASKALLQRIEREGIERVFPPEQGEKSFRDAVTEDREVARHMLKSDIERWGVPKEWVDGWGLRGHLE